MPNKIISLAEDKDEVIKQKFDSIPLLPKEEKIKPEDKYTLTIIADDEEYKSKHLQKILREHVSVNAVISTIRLQNFSLEEVVAAADVFNEGRINHVRCLVITNLKDDPKPVHVDQLGIALNAKIDNLIFEDVSPDNVRFVQSLQKLLIHRVTVSHTVASTIGDESSPDLHEDLIVESPMSEPLPPLPFWQPGMPTYKLPSAGKTKALADGTEQKSAPTCVV